MVRVNFHNKDPVKCDSCNYKSRFMYTRTKVARVYHRNYDYDVFISHKCLKCIIKNIFKKERGITNGTIN